MRSAVTLAVAFLAGCGGDPVAPSATCTAPPCDSDDPPPIAASCPAELVALPDGAGCDARLPDGECPPGTMPRLGSTACEPVGWTECPAGFALDPSGWGCRADVPPSACTGATRDSLGEGCVPIGDCSAPFPPPEATYLVDPAFGAAELDATHVLTIAEALAAAPDGATIAVFPGSYAESIVPVRSVSIAGTCAGEVEILGSAADKLGVLVEGDLDVSLSGIAVRTALGGIAVYGGASVAVSDVLVEDVTLVGIVVSDAGSTLDVERSVVRNTLSRASGKPGSGAMSQKGALLTLHESAVVGNALSNVTSFGAGSMARVERSVVRDGVPQTTGALAGQGGFGVYAYIGGGAEIVESALYDHVGEGVFSRKTSDGGVASDVLVERSEIRGVALGRGGDIGRGVEASGGATLTVRSSTISDAIEAHVMVTEGSFAAVEGSTILGPSDGAAPSGTGILVAEASELDVSGSVVIRARNAAFVAQDGGRLGVRRSLTRDPLPQLAPEPGTTSGAIGLYVYAGGSADVEDSAIVAQLGNGAFVKDPGGSIRLAGTLVADIVPDPDGFFGRAAGAQDGGVLHVERCAFVRTRDVAVLVADGASSATFIDSTIRDTAFNADGFMGHGIVGQGAVRLDLSGTTILGSAGVGLGLSGSAAFVSRSFLSHNSVGVHVQDGSTLLEADEPSSDPKLVVVTRDTAFVGNLTRVGTGVLPLPSPVSP